MPGPKKKAESKRNQVGPDGTKSLRKSLTCQVLTETKRMIEQEKGLAQASGHKHIDHSDIVDAAIALYLGALTKVPDHIRLSTYQTIA
jgi:hypothetical protein